MSDAFDSQFSEAWQESTTTNPASALMLHTLELRQADMAAVWLVADEQDQTFKLEDDAPRRPGEWVTFQNCPFQGTEFKQKPDEMPSLTLQVDNTLRLFGPYIKAAAQSRNPVYVRYRGYVLSRPHELGTPPTDLVIYSALEKGSLVTFDVRMFSLQKSAFLRLVYDRENYPMMV